MSKACYGYSDHAQGARDIMNIMLKFGVQVVSVTDNGNSMGWGRFHVFGIAANDEQIKSVSNFVDETKLGDIKFPPLNFS